MADSDSRPVCRYDGRCYRKNEDHFLNFAHPKQQPTLKPPSATVTTPPAGPPAPAVPTHAAVQTTVIATPPSSPRADSPTPPATPIDLSDVEASPTPKVSQSQGEPAASEQTHHHHAAPRAASSSQTRAHHEKHESHTTAVMEEVEDEDALEAGPPSLSLLQHLMNPRCHPDPRYVGMEPDERDASAPALPFSVCELYPEFHAVHHYLHRLYGNALGFHDADVCAVLQAAVQIAPASPLTAFTGWRLVGPFEAAYRAYSHAQRAGHHTLAWFDPFHDESARWRCARYRHDPPECQTIAVSVHPPPPCTSSCDPPPPPVHLCYHRDDPSEVPSMVVKSGVSSQEDGASTEPTPKSAYTWTPVSSSLAAFLLASAREMKDAKAEAALSQAMRVTAASAASAAAAAVPSAKKKADDFPDPQHVAGLSEQQKATSQKRKNRQLAATVHGLGIVAPFNRQTELGYRPLVMSRAHLKTLLENWDTHFKRWCQLLRDSTPGESPPKIPRLESSTGLIFTSTPWSELQEQFRYANMANDEGDFGLNLELGIDLFALVATPSLLPAPGAQTVHAAEAALKAARTGAAPITEEMKRGLNPLLWHTFRVLDCVYMLLNHDVYRHVLRCHVPMLAGVDLLLKSSWMEIATGAHLWAKPSLPS